MKICVTGVNSVQCGHIPKIDYVSSIKCLVGTLRKEHRVEVRPLPYAEICDEKPFNLDNEYHVTILYLAPFTGFIGVYAPHAIKLLSRALRGTLKVVVSYDDWQIAPILGSLRSLKPRIDKILDENPFGWKDISQVRLDRHNLVQDINDLCDGDWDLPSLVPAWDGGDLSLLSLPTKLSRAVCYSPNAYFRDYYQPADRPESKTDYAETASPCWTLAALHDHGTWLKKQNLTWPVHQFGKKKAGQEKLPESEIFQIYYRSSGILSPSYKHAGSGWWRARYGFAADCLVPIAGNPDEAAMLGEAYNLKPDELETLSHSELVELAEYQRAAYYDAPNKSLAVMEERIKSVLL